MLSRLDSTAAQRLLVGLPKQLMDRLQSVQNATTRLIFRTRRYDHVQPLLRSLHWLRVPERISFRLAVLVYRCLHDSACTRLAGVRSSTRLRPRRTSAAALAVYVSARRPTHRACYHRRPSLPGGCCICLEQFAGLNFLSGLTAVLRHERLMTRNSSHYCYASLQS